MERDEIAVDEYEFRMRVVESLARLETLAQSTDEHLGRLNGTVARHEKRIGALQAAVLTEQVEARTTSAWWRRMSPLVWLVAGGLLVLFLLHSDQLLRVFSKP